jgi:hypothetical protein
VRERTVRVFVEGEWTVLDSDDEGPTPQQIRNVVAGTLFAREAGLP